MKFDEQTILKNVFGGDDFSSVKDLLSYLKKFKIKQKDFFEEYYPRFDLLTGQKIEYKDISSYFHSDFINKNNLKKYLKNNIEDGKKWAIEYLFDRKEEKQLIYSPSQTELRSLFCPSVPYYESIGGYNNICKELGYKVRYDYDTELKYKDLKNPTIIIDNREQNPLRLAVKTENGTINTGDYVLKGSKNNIFVERKSISDFTGTLSKGYERFGRELDRVVENNSYLVMLVENDINSSLNFSYLPQMKYTKASPSFIFKHLRELLTKYPNHFQCLFVDGRIEASKILMSIFKLGKQVKKIDLQYYYEKGELR